MPNRISSRLGFGGSNQAGAFTARSKSDCQELVNQADDLAERLSRIQRQRSTVNYTHWKTRCEYEKTSEMILARKLIADAGGIREFPPPLSASAT